jgi:nucleoid-associated protein YgaU
MPSFASSQILGALIAFSGTTLLPGSINSEAIRLLVFSIRAGMAAVLLSMILVYIIRILIFNKHLFKKLVIPSIMVLTAFVGIVWRINIYFNKKMVPSIHTSVYQTSTPTASSENISLPTTHIVKKGESLWTISVTYYGKGALWKKIMTGNKSTIIHPGNKLEIPSV